MTKGITIIKKDKKVKMCQYGSSDGYPSGQGQDLIDVLHKYGIDNIKNKIDICEFYEDDNHPNYFDTLGTFGAEMIETMMQLPPGLKLYLTDNGIHAEWVYIIDFDKGLFEIKKNGKKYEKFDLDNLPNDISYLDNCKKGPTKEEIEWDKKSNKFILENMDRSPKRMSFQWYDEFRSAIDEYKKQYDEQYDKLVEEFAPEKFKKEHKASKLKYKKEACE